MITANRIEAFLQVMQEQSHGHWAHQRLDDAETPYWVINFDRSYPSFQFFVEFNEEMLYVQYIFRDFRPKPDCWLAIYRVLLRLNEELSLVKFGLTAALNVTLMGELAASQLSLDAFQNLLQLLVQYLEDLYWEIGIVAESEPLTPFLTLEERSLQTKYRLARRQVQRL